MNINYDYYKIFYFVVKNLSFSKASEELFITQSAVSQSIKSLEHKLGITLFYRHKKKISLTKEGNQLYTFIKPAIESITQGETLIKNMTTLDKGEVIIAISDTLCKYYLINPLKEFNARYPNIKIKIINKPSPTNISMVLEGEADLSIVNLFNIDNTIIDCYTIKKSPLVFISPNKYAELQDTCVDLNKILSYPLLTLSTNSTTRMIFDEYLSHENLIIKPELELESMDLLVEFCKMGLGISLVSKDSIINSSVNDFFLLDVIEQLPEINIGLIKNKTIPLSPSATALYSIIENYYNQSLS